MRPSMIAGSDEDIEECPLFFNLISNQHGSYSRFMQLFSRSQTEAGASTLTFDEDASVTLFPSMLPWRGPPGKSRGKRGTRGFHRRAAFKWLQSLWGLFNFLEGGSPCTPQAASHVIDRASKGVWTAIHEDYARAMFYKLVFYVSRPRGTMERGTSTLDELIEKISLSMYDPSICLENGMSGAKEVDHTRVSLPECAAILDPRDHLKGNRLLEFEAMNEWVPMDHPIHADPKPCHKVAPSEWGPLLRKLHQAGMISFVPVEEALQENGKIIRGGLFCVAHKPSSDRLINDRRPLNAREHRLGWCELPAGPMLNQLIVDRDQSVRCSGDDLSNYFYLIKHLDSWLHRNCFGDPIKGSLLKGLGLDKNKKYLPAFRVVCMGDTNGVDIAQATHEAVLEKAGCLRPENKLVYGKVFPASNTLEGLYIDDHLVFQVVEKKKTRPREKMADETLIAQSRSRYAELGLPTSEKKAINKAYEFKAWGTSITSDSGRVGAPVEKLRQLEHLAGQLLLEGYATKKALQKLVGLFVHPFMHRRECMALFHHIYIFIDRMPEVGIKRLPHYVRDEILCAILVLPLAHSNVRHPVSVQISASDASSKRGGRAVTLTSKSFAKTLYRHAEVKGEHVRLDWKDHFLSPPSDMRQAPAPLADALQKHHWTASQSMRFDKAERINLLELEMVKQEIKRRANNNKGRARVVNLCDSRVVVGCFAKGRSSSRNLNHRLRSCIPWLLTSELQLVNLWVATDKNPADHPSRNSPIPPPNLDNSTDPLLDQHLLKSVQEFRSLGVQGMLETEARIKGTDPVFESLGPSHNPCKSIDTPKSKGDINETQCVFKKPPEQQMAESSCRESSQRGKASVAAASRLSFREIFAGKGKLTKCMQQVGIWEVLEPLEYMKGKLRIESMNILNPRVFTQLKKDASVPNQIWHFGLPCGSFSIIQHSNQGTRRKYNPAGDNSLLREVEGNLILARTMMLIDILERHGNFWTLENPKSSYVWLMPSLKRKLLSENCWTTEFDQCRYGLKLLDDSGKRGPCKKPTRIAGNFPSIRELTKKCSCHVPHVHAIGGVRTKVGWQKRSELAGHYPAQLCKAYSHAVQALAQRTCESN